MKQQEKTRRTQELILAAAMKEFGAKGCEAASINRICTASGVSKGLLYHNFTSKDDLYIHCIQKCFSEMTRYLQAQDLAAGDVGRLLALRERFLTEHPDHKGLVLGSVILPPAHLCAQIREARQAFDSFCMDHYRQALSRLTLRPQITPEMALNYFVVFMDMFNSYFEQKARQGENHETLMKLHEENLAAAFDMMLYGIARPEGEA